MDYYSIQNKIRELTEQNPIEKGVQDAPVNSGNINFDDILSKMVEDVDSLQQEATHAISGLVENEAPNDEAMGNKMAEADNAYNLMMQIRHKLVDMYAEVEKRSPEGEE